MYIYGMYILFLSYSFVGVYLYFIFFFDLRDGSGKLNARERARERQRETERETDKERETERETERERQIERDREIGSRLDGMLCHSFIETADEGDGGFIVIFIVSICVSVCLCPCLCIR